MTLAGQLHEALGGIEARVREPVREFGEVSVEVVRRAGNKWGGSTKALYLVTVSQGRAVKAAILKLDHVHPDGSTEMIPRRKARNTKDLRKAAIQAVKDALR